MCAWLQIPLVGAGTIPHLAEAYYHSAHTVLVPASDGTGCIAGGAVRSVLELAGALPPGSRGARVLGFGLGCWDSVLGGGRVLGCWGPGLRGGSEGGLAFGGGGGQGLGEGRVWGFRVWGGGGRSPLGFLRFRWWPCALSVLVRVGAPPPLPLKSQLYLPCPKMRVPPYE